MPTQHPALRIEIVGEKVVQRASKGRNQWLFLKTFDGRTVGAFTDAAKAHTRQSLTGTFQQGNWWDRELSYCLEKRVIRLVDTQVVSAPSAAPAVATSAAMPGASQGVDKPLPAASSDQRPARTMGNNSPVLAGQAGLYLVMLNNQEPISTNAADPRIAERCAKVNREHCKFGRAKDFAKRRGNYEETFGTQNVNFLPIAALAEADLAAAERCVLEQVSAYKIRGPSGYRLEWLKGIRPEQLIQIAQEALHSNHITHSWLI